MTIRIDPEGNEIRALLDLLDLGAQDVLEIGCGDGRLTWRYADKVAHVTAVDPFAGGIERAMERLTRASRGRVEFHHGAFEAFAAASEPSTFDIGILSWSLCWMEHEGMVHALEGIKRLLRPGGSLIDIHPVLEAPLIEVSSGGRISFSEPSPGYDYEEDLRQAEDALARIVERGTFVIDRSCEFDFLTYGSSVAELRDFMAEAGAYDTRPQDTAVIARQAELYARVEDVMRASGEKAEVAFHERGRMTRLTPVSW